VSSHEIIVYAPSNEKRGELSPWRDAKSQKKGEAMGQLRTQSQKGRKREKRSCRGTQQGRRDEETRPTSSLREGEEGVERGELIRKKRSRIGRGEGRKAKGSNFSRIRKRDLSQA